MRVVARGDVDSRAGAGWGDVHLAHEALPVVDLDEVDLGATFLGHRLRAPLLIAGMTGGHRAAREVNAVLAAAAERHGVAMGLGSQRAALRSPHLADTYSVARELAPSSLLVANIGAAQLVRQRNGDPLTPEQLGEAVGMLRADALAIHLNFLEEAVQPEGDRRVFGLREALPAAVAAVGVPCIAKETGAGMSRGAALQLAGMGFSALDVGGVGGSSFAAVEGERAAEWCWATLAAGSRTWATAKSIGRALPDVVRELLDGRDPAGRVGFTILLLTTSGEGWPQVAMLSVGEVLAVDERRVRLALWAG